MAALKVLTELGTFSVGLYTDRAPDTCNYFIEHAANGLLNGGCVHRIVTDKNQRCRDLVPIHVVQLGSKDKLDANRHIIDHESTRRSGLRHRQWHVSAARFNPGEVYGSFFICMRDEPELDYGGMRNYDGEGFAVFGRVTAGFDVVSSIYQLAEETEELRNEIAVISVTAE